MTDAGYTLTETLAALLVVGLGISSFMLGVQVIAGQQVAVGSTLTRLQSARATQTWIESRLEEGGPYESHQPERLTGDAVSFKFTCGAEATCVVRLEDADGGRRIEAQDGRGQTTVFRLAGRGSPHFTYRGEDTSTDRWPPERGEQREALREVALLELEGGVDRPLFAARVWVEQPVACAFDPILQGCR